MHVDENKATILVGVICIWEYGDLLFIKWKINCDRILGVTDRLLELLKRYGSLNILEGGAYGG